MSKLNLRFYIKKYRLNSVFLRNLIMIILISTIPFGVSCFLVYQRAVSSMKSESKLIEQKRLEKMAGSLDNFIKSMDKLSVVILQQPEVQQVFSTKESVTNLSSKYISIMNDLNLFTLTYGYIKDIKVYSELNGSVVSQVAVTRAENDNSGLSQNYEKAGDDLYIAASDLNGSGIKTVTFLRKKKIGNENLGAVSIEVNIDRLFEELGISYNDENDRLMLVGSEGSVFLSSYIADINKDAEAVCGSGDFYSDGGTQYIISRIEAASEKYSYVHMYNEVYYTRANGQMVRLIVILIFFSLLAVIYAAVYISTKTFRPLAEILEYFGSEKNGEKNKNDLNELGDIIRSIASLESENSNLTEEMQQRIIMMNHAQLGALQNQINPHFMYNTLETIKWVVMDLEEDDDKASSMIEMLADVISYSLDMEHYLVSLEEEIRNTKVYVEILKIRYENKFEVEWDIDPELKEARILKLCLQPLIENAMVHGIAPKRREGRIYVSAKQKKGKLFIEVSDDGVGMSEEKLSQLRKSLEKNNGASGRHMGLKNVNLRIRLAFGEEYGILVKSEKDKGTKVLIINPLE